MAPKKKALPNPLPDGLIVTDTEKKSWKLGKVIGSGGFGLIYLGNSSRVESASLINYADVGCYQTRLSSPPSYRNIFFLRKCMCTDVNL